MKESHVEGVATHDDPESCIGTREVDGEALDRGTCGLGIEPRNARSRAPTPLCEVARQHERHRYREMQFGSARSETPCAYGTSLHENREISGTPAAVVRWAASERPRS
jgi:hypothetical protein